MSQITCCPACQTRFKVVADQLRISDGWVRCGNCQQVFDASVSLQAAPAEPMLADMPLSELRGPVARPPPIAPVVPTWGQRRVSHAAAPLPDDLKGLADIDDMEAPDDGFAQTQPGALPPLTDDSAARRAPMFVPSSMKASAPYRPVVPPSPSIARAEPQGVPEPEKRPPALGGAAQTGRVPTHLKSLGDAQQHTPFISPTPGGYELPAPQFEEGDTEWPALFDESPAAAHKQEPTGRLDRSEAGELDLAHFIAEIAGKPKNNDERELPAAEPKHQIAPSDLEPQVVEGSLDGTHDIDELVLGLDEEVTEPAELSLMEDAGPSQPPALHGSAQVPTAAEGSSGNAAQSHAELSFVRRARRRAFWSGTGIRVGLVLLAIGLLVGLLGQMAFRERARLAAAWPQSRTLLEAACARLQCSVGSYRDIGSVLVDGSAFNRVHGDRYQFSLTLRSRAALPVQAPAIELTLTDAQEQPVLRRILLPAELSVPSPLSPGQEWSTVVPMTVVSGSARIAGYRVLAFYP